MDRLSEIRACYNEEKADGARGYMIHTADVGYLLAEIEKLNKDAAAKYLETAKLTARTEKAEAERDKAVSDMKYYLDTNEDNGVVYVPKFAVEQMISALTTKGE